MKFFVRKILTTTALMFAPMVCFAAGGQGDASFETGVYSETSEDLQTLSDEITVAQQEARTKEDLILKDTEEVFQDYLGILGSINGTLGSVEGDAKRVRAGISEINKELIDDANEQAEEIYK